MKVCVYLENGIANTSWFLTTCLMNLGHTFFKIAMEHMKKNQASALNSP